MKCNASFVAVMLSASWASGVAENVATAVNIISGITADEEYCLSAQGGDTMGSVRVRGGGAQVRTSSEITNLDFTSIAHVGDGKGALQLGRGRLACHLIVCLLVAPCIVSTLRLKIIRVMMHWRQVVSA